MLSSTATSDVTGLGADGAAAVGAGCEGAGCAVSVCGTDKGDVAAMTGVIAAGTGFVCAGAGAPVGDGLGGGVVEDKGRLDGVVTVVTDVSGAVAARDGPLLPGVAAEDGAIDVDGVGLDVVAGSVGSADSAGVGDGVVFVGDAPSVEEVAGEVSESLAGEAWVADPSLDEVAGGVSAAAVPCPAAHAPTMATAPPAIFAARTQSLLTLMNSPSHMATVKGTDTI